MTPDEWTRRCADRLRQQWPHAPEDELRDAAAELWSEPRWRDQTPEVATVMWLRLGVLAK
ncbi:MULTISPECIES: hypothetical protein [unclassified Methylibium]|uniref:hypothetical protein n=1 Tax=unclassified Methylibium TaxID=2633235 RepID=UPI0003F4703E|nr:MULTISPECIES: hypothetical protein [unclassified Methylibium]EWS52541.1 hypothetical protein X551_04671 [Methylibium sp. T29]EWS61513.1 hypothetical protein Y694_00787 [Methylibium sp. T29-B]